MSLLGIPGPVIGQIASQMDDFSNLFGTSKIFDNKLYQTEEFHFDQDATQMPHKVYSDPIARRNYLIKRYKLDKLTKLKKVSITAKPAFIYSILELLPPGVRNLEIHFPYFGEGNEFNPENFKYLPPGLQILEISNVSPNSNFERYNLLPETLEYVDLQIEYGSPIDKFLTLPDGVISLTFRNHPQNFLSKIPQLLDLKIASSNYGIDFSQFFFEFS